MAGKSAWNPIRLSVIASMIGRHCRGAVIDLGCERGELLGMLDPSRVTSYVAVDREAAMLAEIPPHAAIPISRVTASIETFVPTIAEAGAIVCAEALYFVDHADRVLADMVGRMSRLDAVIVSMVTPIPEKPNWARSVGRTSRELESLGWSLLERTRVWGEESGRHISWDIQAFDPRRSLAGARATPATRGK